jgi:hypothetical protein
MPAERTHARRPSARPRPRLFRALGAGEPPAAIRLRGVEYHRTEVLKHDSWAATAIYEGPAGRVVCKFNRREPVLGLPMAWLGRWLATREATMLARCADLANVPAGSGRVMVGGRVLPNAVAHEYVPGHPLMDRERVADTFFPRLRGLLAELHRRGLAYVDLHKRENVIVGDDGEPYLIDFQISVGLPSWGPLGAVLRLLQHSDDYHLDKHVARNRPDQCLGRPTGRMPWSIRLHRLFAQPLRSLRRRLLVLAGVRKGRGRAETEHCPEDAVRRGLAARQAA